LFVLSVERITNNICGVAAVEEIFPPGDWDSMRAALLMSSLLNVHGAPKESPTEDVHRK
jgi:hypothetical protein